LHIEAHYASPNFSPFLGAVCSLSLSLSLSVHALYQHSHELTSRSEFHRYLSRDLISEIMAELFARYIIRDNSSYDGKERKRLTVGDGFRMYSDG